jgi:hypothetical protein
MIINYPLYQTQLSTFDPIADRLFSTLDQLTALTNFLQFHCDRTMLFPMEKTRMHFKDLRTRVSGHSKIIFSYLGL